MEKKRAPGITEIGRGKFRIRVRGVDPATGKLKEVDRIVENITVKEAIRLKEEWRAELRAGKAQGRGQRVTVEDFATSWLSMKLPRLKPATADRYASALDLHINPCFGAIYLDALSRADIDEWIAERAMEYRPETINGWLRILKAMCKDAAADLGFTDPSVRVTPLPTNNIDGHADRVGLTAEEARRLLDVVKDESPDQFALLLTLILTGMRWGEATALKWSDIDVKHRVIRIVRSHHRKRVSSPKTKTSIRLYPLPPGMGKVFQDHWDLLRIEKHPGLEKGLVFATRSSKDPEEATLRVPSSWQKCLPKWLAAAEITKHITPHSFRRTNVDVLRWAKVEPVVARSLVGHATQSMTETYSTVVEDEKRDAVARVADLIGVGASGG